MEHPLEFIQVLLILLLLVYATQASISDSFFYQLESGHNITGTLGVELYVKTSIHCSVICLVHDNCKGFRYKGTGPGNCLLIYRSETGEIFYNDNIGVIYETVWKSPSGWTGPDAALYQGFDGSYGLLLMEGIYQMNSIPLVSGRMNSAWTVDHTKKQWIDLGIDTEACITRPETCSAAGGAISMWLNIVTCPLLAGIISSKVDGGAGSALYCRPDHNKISAFVYRTNGFFETSPSARNGWTHVVVNYVGPDNGEKLQVFYNGAYSVHDGSLSGGSYAAGDGRIVVGRAYTNEDRLYASVQIDELVFFNRALTSTEIQKLYTSV